MTVRLVPFMDWHSEKISIRKEQPPKAPLGKNMPTYSYTLLTETDEIVAILWAQSMTERTLHIGAVFCEEVNSGKYTRDIVSFSRYLLNALKYKCSRLQLTVDCEFEQAHRFAHFLGFSTDCVLRNYMGRDKHYYLMSCEGNTQ